MTEVGDQDEQFEALCEAYLAQLRAGDAPDVDAVAAAHPMFATRIRRLFPMLRVMEGVKETGPAPQALAAAAPAPEHVGPYRVLRRIGRGGMGQVFEAEGPDAQRVALKLIHAHLLDETEYVARFQREAEAGRRIEHPSIVRTLEAGTATVGVGGVPQPYIVLEYVDGQNLRELLAELGTVSERLARVIGARIADALAAIHDAGMVHRDLKPENVLITPDEQVRVMDLGVALIQDEAMRLSRSGVFVGSFLYAAPEQLRGRDLDGRADLYSLGLILHELVAGHLPEADDEGGLLPQVGGGRIADRISPFLTHLIRALIAPDVSERLPRAAEVADLLRDGERSTWWRGQPDVQSPGPDALADREPSFQGREHELRLLSGLAQQAAGGRGHVLLLEGEAGLGKSRLLQEWWRRQPSSTPAGPARIEVRFEPPGSFAPVDGFAQGVRRFLGEGHVEPALAELLGDDEGQLSVARAALLPAATAGTTGIVAAPPLEPAVRAVLRALLARGPVVLVVEDLHFADATARALFVSLARTVREERMLLVATARPEEGAGWGQDLLGLAFVERYVLPPLASDACHELLHELLGSTAAAEAGSGDLIRSADGNPFYLVELARAFAARRESATPQRRDTPVGQRIPDTVRALVESRLGALPDDERELLQAAACCGALFDPVLVCDALDMPRIGGLKGFHRLDRRHALLEARGPRYRFRHHLVLEILYEELPDPLRHALHGALGRVLAARSPAGASMRGPATLDVLRHFLLADDLEAALPYAEVGLTYAYESADTRKAEELALRLLAHREALGDALCCHALCILAHCELTRAAPDEALGHFAESYALAEASGAPQVKADVGVHYGYALRRAGHMPASRRVLTQAVADGERAEDPGLVVRARATLVTTLVQLGEIVDAKAHAEEALALARTHQLAALEPAAAGALGSLEVEAGDPERGQTLLEHAWTRASLAGDWTTEVNAMTSLIKRAFMRSDMELSISLNERLLARARDLGHIQLQANCLINGANLLNASGRLVEARERGLQGLEVCARTGHAQGEAHSHFIVANCELSLGAWAASAHHYDACLQRAELIKDPALQASIHGRLAALHAWMGDFDTARDHLASGEATVPQETPSARGILDLALSDVLAAEGDFAAAVAHLEALEPKIRAGGRMPQVSSLMLLRTLFRLEGGDVEGARGDLMRLEEISGEMGALSDRRLHNVLSALVRDGDHVALSVMMRDHASEFSRHRRVHVLGLLAERYQDDGFREQAREELRALVAAAPEALRSSMRNAVPLHRRLLAAPRG